MLELLQHQFFINALVGMLLVAIASAMIGTYIVSRRLVSLSGGITHACFGGLGLGYYLGISPIAMAGIFAVASSLAVEWLSHRGRVREDSAIAVVWALGMALGVLFVFLTPGYVPELNNFLFGNILTISYADLWAFGVFLLIVSSFFALRFRAIVACAFDPDFARTTGLNATLINALMTAFTAICIVLTIRMVGIMLLMSMLTLPQLIAELFSHRFNRIMLISVGASVACCIGGLFIAGFVNVPASALIVMIMIVLYALCAVVRHLRERIGYNESWLRG